MQAGRKTRAGNWMFIGSFLFLAVILLLFMMQCVLAFSDHLYYSQNDILDDLLTPEELSQLSGRCRGSACL